MDAADRIDDVLFRPDEFGGRRFAGKLKNFFRRWRRFRRGRRVRGNILAGNHFLDDKRRAGSGIEDFFLRRGAVEAGDGLFAGEFGGARFFPVGHPVRFGLGIRIHEMHIGICQSSTLRNSAPAGGSGREKSNFRRRAKFCFGMGCK